MIKSTTIDLQNYIKRQAQMQWKTDLNDDDVMEAIDLGAVNPKEEKTFTHMLQVPTLPQILFKFIYYMDFVKDYYEKV